MQVGGIFVSKRIDEVEDTALKKSGRINSTWGGSLVDMVRRTRVLEIIVEEKLVENAKARGDELQGLRGARRASLVGNARGKGLMCAVDPPDRATSDAVIKECFAAGMIVLPCGPRRCASGRP